MNLSFDLQRFAPIAVAAVLAAAGLFFVGRGVTGGGGGGDHSASAQQVVQQAFAGGGKGPDSGRVKGTLTVAVSVPGGGAAGASPGNFTATVDGAFDGANGSSPKADVEIEASGAGKKASFGVVSTGKQAFVEVDGRAYEMPPSQVRQLTHGGGQAGGKAGGKAGGASQDDVAALAALGIDPRDWLKNPSDAGTAQVGGEPTRHVTAEVDVPAMFADLTDAAQRSGQGRAIPSDARRTIEQAVKEAQVDVFASEKDGSLRRMTVSAKFEAQNPRGGEPVAGTFRFDLELTEAGKAQTIEAPRHAQPFSKLPPGLGLSGLSGGLSGISGALPAATGAASKPPKHDAASKPPAGTAPTAPAAGSDAGSAPGGDATRSSQAYVACVQKALDLQALKKCQALVP